LFQLRFVAWKAVRLVRGFSRDERRQAVSSGFVERRDRVEDPRPQSDSFRKG
jgi:hypothetical protein